MFAVMHANSIVILINTTALHDVFCFLHAICKANFPDDVGLRKDSTTFIIFSNAVVSVVFSWVIALLSVTYEIHWWPPLHVCRSGLVYIFFILPTYRYCWKVYELPGRVAKRLLMYSWIVSNLLFDTGKNRSRFVWKQLFGFWFAWREAIHLSGPDRSQWGSCVFVSNTKVKELCFFKTSGFCIYWFIVASW